MRTFAAVAFLGSFAAPAGANADELNRSPTGSNSTGVPGHHDEGANPTSSHSVTTNPGGGLDQATQGDHRSLIGNDADYHIHGRHTGHSQTGSNAFPSTQHAAPARTHNDGSRGGGPSSRSAEHAAPQRSSAPQHHSASPGGGANLNLQTNTTGK